MLATFLKAHGIMQLDLVRGLPADPAQVSRWANDPDANLLRENIDRILAFLSGRLGRPVTYEEAFKDSNGQAA